MNKIGTISLNINTHDLNYGAILHSWAFQQVLIKLGYETEVIDYTTPHVAKMNRIYPYKSLWKEGRVKATLLAIARKKTHRHKYDKFEQFKNHNIRISQKKYTHESFGKEIDYPTLICESDVVWDPNFFSGEFDSAFFLVCQKKCKKIAYSVSAGNMEFSNNQKNTFMELIQNLDYISCRESYLTDYVASITSKKILWALDPVLLLDVKDYEKIVSMRIEKKPYLLVYSPVGYNNDLYKKARCFAKKHDLLYIEISNNPWNNVFGKTVSACSVEDFLSYIMNAEIVFTDSFHGTCFAILFHRLFYSFPRTTGRKTQDLCHRFKLDDRYDKSTFDIKQRIDYETIEKIRSKHVAECIAFIRHSVEDY